MRSGTEETLERTGEIARAQGDRRARARSIAELIRAARGYRWVGLYDVEPAEIAVIAWAGPGAPTYPRFPRTQGLNGAAVAKGTSIVVFLSNSKASSPLKLGIV